MKYASHLKIVMLLMASALVFLSCSSRQEAGNITPPDKLPDQIMENSVVVFTVNGIKSTVVKAKYVEKFLADDLTIARGLYVDFFDKEGTHTSVLVADSGNIREVKQNLEVRGEVVFTTDRGVNLETKSLRWDPNLNKILTDDFVKVTRGKDVVTGYGLESDPELKHITIKRNVSGEIKDINAEEPI